MISSRPNLAYLKAAWAAHASISAENCRQGYDEAGITFEQVNHSWIVRKNNTLVSTMPLRYTRQELRMGFLGRIEMEARKAAAEIEGGLLRDLALPEHYTMIVEVERSMRHLRQRGQRALAISIGPATNSSGPMQVHAEILVFLDAPRACLFAYRDGVDLLVDLHKKQRHPRAATYAELAQRLAATINETFSEMLLSEAA
ncbi:hypothetical protein [Dyella caseinilytica]|uniref:DUF5753 domain-containing protein n=1 Tax=Dyella caseinilytica TaxID=1849581 RepID=A0ABX7GRG1_9GAMM|nr:hypothetical protein [Dyella caseinilytica]QRN53002.1 hypothetical protein ISN74_16395 [Dyella caseinilytica]GGA10689.1 hypothetical protein GCM10011408_35000 [Dyella caseinilytica]